ncbi:hypothetical protein MB901379_03669 [Mycobacterium basiliense]|uniref:DUF4190 domain-containing protein n=1 Tax=Mycobacterium basiliense TaxID=2094119 RepID=A0A447GHU7_9MYCO|nr:DUF4190 domain-containing protein [Mycobacterium basiliense]VDM90076.1 hypothetical protein MB901379_03669 [Mycobacterium basiliense]
MTGPGGSSDEDAHEGEAPPFPAGEQAFEQPGPPSYEAPWAAPGMSSPAADYPPPPHTPPHPAESAGYPPDFATGYPPPMSTDYPPYGSYSPPAGEYPEPSYPPPMAPPYGGPPGGYPPPSYPAGYYPAPDYLGGYGPAQPGTNSLAIVSLVSSLVGVLCCIGSVVAIVTGTIALNQIKQTRQDGYGLAVAGIVIGIAVLLIGLIVGIFSIPSR